MKTKNDNDDEFEISKGINASRIDEKYKDIFDIIFSKNETVLLSDLEDDLYCDKLKTQIIATNKDKIKTYWKTKFFIVPIIINALSVMLLLAFSSLACTIVQPFFTFNISTINIILTFVYIAICTTSLAKHESKIWDYITIISFIIYNAITILFIVLSAKIIPTFFGYYQYFYFQMASSIYAFMHFYKSRKTEFGNQMYARVKGFENFIRMVKTKELKLLVKDTPHLYFDVLPYAYVMGISKEWIEKFRFLKLDMDKNNKYYSATDILLIAHISSLQRNLNSFTSNISPFKNSNGFSGGSFGGGGFSGGGGGGGGFGAR